MAGINYDRISCMAIDTDWISVSFEDGTISVRLYDETIPTASGYSCVVLDKRRVNRLIKCLTDALVEQQHQESGKRVRKKVGGEGSRP